MVDGPIVGMGLSFRNGYDHAGRHPRSAPAVPAWPRDPRRPRRRPPLGLAAPLLRLCCGCGRRFVASPKKGPISDERKDLIRRLLLERLSLRAIAQVAGVSRSWLQGFVNSLFREETPWAPGPLEKSLG